MFGLALFICVPIKRQQETNTTMSTEDQALWDLVDRYIEISNDACNEMDPGQVAEALLYAAARFNAFMVAASSESRKDFIEDKEDAGRFISKQFNGMLFSNLDDYQENYKVYIRQDEPAGE